MQNDPQIQNSYSHSDSIIESNTSTMQLSLSSALPQLSTVIRYPAFTINCNSLLNGLSLQGLATINNNSNNKIMFMGEYANSKRNGFGIELDEDGSLIYEGQYKNDKFEGWGRTKDYTGQFRCGLYEGFGIYSTPSIYYEGMFQNNLFSGHGTLFLGENMSFTPIRNIHDFLSSLLSANMGNLSEYNINEVYVGEFIEGEKAGLGKIWRSNYWYAGQFAKGKPYGVGAEQLNENGVKQVTYKLNSLHPN